MTCKTCSTRKSTGKRVVLGILVFILCFCALSMILSAAAYRGIFARRPEPDTTLMLNYSDLDGSQYPREAVRFPSGDNLLGGWWYPSENPKGIVLVVHGLHSNGDNHLPETVYFVDHGLSVLAMDCTGAGSSEGDSVVGLSQSKFDVVAAVDYIRQRERELPLFLFGHSMGGYGVTAALAENIDVDAVVSVAGFSTPVGLMYQYVKDYAGILADVEYPFLRLQNWFVFGSEGSTDAARAIEQSAVPVLLIGGSEDAVIPDEVRLDADNVSGPNVSYLTVTEKFRNGHSGVWLSADAAEYGEELRKRLDALTEAYDGKVPEDQLAQFSSEIDKERLSQVDPLMMNTILDFYFAEAG